MDDKLGYVYFLEKYKRYCVIIDDNYRGNNQVYTMALFWDLTDNPIDLQIKDIDFNEIGFYSIEKYKLLLEDILRPIGRISNILLNFLYSEAKNIIQKEPIIGGIYFNEKLKQYFILIRNSAVKDDYNDISLKYVIAILDNKRLRQDIHNFIHEIDALYPGTYTIQHQPKNSVDFSGGYCGMVNDELLEFLNNET